MNKANRLIVFLIPPKKVISGGILSIFSICEVSRKYHDIHKSDVVIATYPGHTSYHQNDLFNNSEFIYSFDDIVSRGTPESLQIHIPEYASLYVLERLAPYDDYLSRIPQLSINILNQNILLMESPVDTANWFTLTSEVTQTTAHNKYSSQELADNYDLPTHHLSTFVDSNQYKWIDFEKKENVIALSPDKTKKRAATVQALKDGLPDFKLVTIQNMKYDEYKELIGKAKFTITFGEGFDGYYVEPYFSGGVSFAVYNDDFFPDKEFSKFKNVYPDYEAMVSNIAKDIKLLNNRKLYSDIVEQNLNKINRLYSFKQYSDNIRNYYLKEYTYYPSKGSAEKLIGQILKARNKLTEQKDQQIEEQLAELNDIQRAVTQKDQMLAMKDRQIDAILHSSSWKLTTPLRKINSVRKKTDKD